MAMTKQDYRNYLLKINKLRTEQSIRKSRTDFWEYAHLRAPDFYLSDRYYLQTLCHEMQDFYETEDSGVLIVNMPPRMGKSRSAGFFVEWLLGQDKRLKVMTGSYNETLSTTFSKGVRDSIMELKADEDQIVYNDIFPETMIKRGDSSANMWGVVGGNYNYLATSPTGTATGFGANILLIDDLIKNAEEAHNQRVLDKHWNWFTQTMLSRLHEGGKIMIVMTRWALGDLAGRAKQHFEEQGTPVRQVNFKAVQDDGTMLDDRILSKESYESKKRAMGHEIASANYQQEPIDIKGTLYGEFKTYSQLPKRFKRIINYTDTADQGQDNHCSIVAGETFDGEAYILDVIYTKDGMEKTEPAEAKQLHDYEVNIAYIESNSGGRGFARNIERQMWDKYRSRKTSIKWFHQSKNKMSRIISNSTYVMEHIYMPENWQDKWPEFHYEITTFQKEGQNQTDDGCDTLTGVGECLESNNTSAKISAISGW